jgi:hypothetical protein
VVLTKPQSYMEFLNLWKDAALIMTDSGGLQEETTKDRGSNATSASVPGSDRP